MNCAIYSRVSTLDKGQETKNQLLQLRDFASKQGWTITCEYTDRASGTNGDRKEFQAMMRDAARRKFDLLLFWSMDRLTREGTWMTLTYLRQLSAAGVKYKSLTEQYIDSLGPFSEAVIGIIGAVAAMESKRLSERTKAGLARAKAEGKHCGRPRKVLSPRRLAHMRKLRASGETITAIAKRMRLSRVMVWKFLEPRDEQQPSANASRIIRRVLGFSEFGPSTLKLRTYPKPKVA